MKTTEEQRLETAVRNLLIDVQKEPSLAKVLDKQLPC